MGERGGSNMLRSGPPSVTESRCSLPSVPPQHMGFLPQLFLEGFDMWVPMTTECFSRRHMHEIHLDKPRQTQAMKRGNSPRRTGLQLLQVSGWPALPSQIFRRRRRNRSD